jgi:hypothetical protein
VKIVNIISNANDINAQTTTIEESSNSQAAVESNESDDIIIESCVSVHLLKDQVTALKCQLNFINTLLIK